MTVYTTRIMKRLKSIDENWGQDDIQWHYGQGVFATTGASAELECPFDPGITIVDFVGLTTKLNVATWDADDQLSSDGIITSEAITITRNSNGQSAQGFYYLVIGKWANASS